MYISPEEFSEKHFPLNLIKENSSPNTSLYKTRYSYLVKKIRFQDEDDFRQWILCLEYEIKRQNDLAKQFPQHVLEILDHSYEKENKIIEFYMTYNYVCTDRILNIFDEKENPIKKTLKVLEIAMMIKNSGICHNNIKPSNLIIFQTEQSIDYDVLLTDFGSTRTHYRNYEFNEDNKEWQNNYLFYQCQEYLLYKVKPEKFVGLINKIKSDIWALGIIILQLFFHDQTSQIKNLTHSYGLNKKNLQNKIVQLRLQYSQIADALNSLLVDQKDNIEQIYQKILDKYYSNRPYTPHYMKCQPQKVNFSELQYTPQLSKIKDNKRKFIFQENKIFIKTNLTYAPSETNDQISNQTPSIKGSSRRLLQYQSGLVQAIANNESPIKIKFSFQENEKFISNNEQYVNNQESQISEKKEGDQKLINSDQKNKKEENQPEKEKEENDEEDKQYLISNNQFEQQSFAIQQKILMELFRISFSKKKEKQILYSSVLKTILEYQYFDVDLQEFRKKLWPGKQGSLNDFVRQKGELNVPLKFIHYMKMFSQLVQEGNYQGYILNNLYHGIGELKKENKIYIGIFHLGKFQWGSVFEQVDKDQFKQSTGPYTNDQLNGEECEITQFKYTENLFIKLDQYKGGVQEGIISGKGVKTQDQWKYHGDWVNGQKQGFGSLTEMIGTKNEYQYIGEFQGDSITGFRFQSGQYQNRKPIKENIIKTEQNIQKVGQKEQCSLF